MFISAGGIGYKHAGINIFHDGFKLLQSIFVAEVFFHKKRLALTIKTYAITTAEFGILLYLLSGFHSYHTSKTKTMRFSFSKTAIVITAISAGIFLACNSSDNTSTTTETMDAPQTAATDPISRGQYLVTIAGCNDCHSPKVMTARGPVFDSSRLLSGHPAGNTLPPIVKSDWILMAPDITAFVGPWGISYAANLTSDSATGIGAWPEQSFINALRTGKHLGNATDRDILPPMPWPIIGLMTEADLKAVYAYLQSLPPINNKVPLPVAPPDVAKMMAAK